jgi:thiamine transporter
MRILLFVSHCTRTDGNAVFLFYGGILMKTKRLTESAMLIAIAVVLELVGKSIIPPMPFGGQLTLVSMLPIVLISYRHGIRWGLATGFGYALVQMALGAGTVTAAFQPGYFGDGLMLLNALIMCALDYILAYTLLGLGGIFRGKLSNSSLELALGSIVALTGRYLAHILSGWILFSGWAEWFFTQEGFPAWGSALVQSLSPQLLGLTYSVVYNGMYMIPEIILTALAATLIARVPKIVAKVS